MRRSSQSVGALVYGLDVYKESTYTKILDPDGEIVTQQSMPNEEVPAFLSPQEVEKVAMETSTSIQPLYRKLVEEGFPPRFTSKNKLNPTFVKLSRLLGPERATNN